jgi:N-hydroxyarylamine O-acetyltransferase
VDLGDYLKRIDCGDVDLSVSLESLRILQRRHLLAVPFENLDIHWKVRIELDPSKFIEKIVGRRRGGFCYELNGAFNELLRRLGFRTRLVSARVADGRGGFGPEFDHLAILAEIDDLEYLADVGFGAFSAAPISLDPDVEHFDEVGVFKVRRFGESLEVVKRSADGWISEYLFTRVGRELREFAAMCEFHQCSSESHFTKGKLCSLMTPEGRITLTDRSFVKTKGVRREEIAIDSDADFYETLLREFAISKPE